MKSYLEFNFISVGYIILVIWWFFIKCFFMLMSGVEVVVIYINVWCGVNYDWYLS